MEQSLLPLLQGPNLGRVWLIETASEAAGYVVLCFSWSGASGGRTGWIDQLYVEETRRRRGLGAQALNAVLAEARNMSLVTVNIALHAADAATEGLCRSCGFITMSDATLSCALRP